MNLHEFQAKDLLGRFGVPVTQGALISQPDDIPAMAWPEATASRWVAKAQLHSGARGKAGGVRLISSEAELEAFVRDMLGRNLVTIQTGPEGLPVSGVLVEPAIDIAQELYLAIMVDRTSQRVTVIASAQGGMDIEQVSAESPEAIHRVAINPVCGLMPYQARQLAFALGLSPTLLKQFVPALQSLYRCFVTSDASLIEINPLVVTEQQSLIAADAKIVLDDNALYRQRQLAEWRDASQENPADVAAAEHGLNYVSLDGDIACMVNGAGLAMATMDLIKQAGGEPANFLDVGGGTSAAKVAAAFKLILANPRVKAILVNIFGGIVRCDLIAQGLIDAAREVSLELPTVVRLEGTNAELGRQMLAESGLNLVAEHDLATAARRVVQLSAEWGGDA